MTNGQFELSGAPTTTFTQADITNGFVSFVHDGGEVAPSYDVAVSDGNTSTAPAAAATITFSANVDDTPVLGSNSLTVNEGQTVVLAAGDLERLGRRRPRSGPRLHGLERDERPV